jgi:hypothetical protein
LEFFLQLLRLLRSVGQNVVADTGMKETDGQFSSHICYSRRHIAPITSFVVILTVRNRTVCEPLDRYYMAGRALQKIGLGFWKPL